MSNRSMLIAIPLVVATAIAVGLAATNIFPIARPSSTPTPSGANASPSIAASEAASEAASNDSTPLPSLDAQYATCSDVDEASPLALRVEHSTDTGRDWVISVYEDGHVLTPGLTAGDYAGDASDRAWMLARRLTPAGVTHLRDEVMATGLFAASASYYPVALPGVEPPGRGAFGYAITVGSGADAVLVSWTSMYGDDALYYKASPEREALDVVGARMMVFDTWLPTDGWAERNPCTVQAARFRVYVDAQPNGGAIADLPPDIAKVPWPLGGDILSWGTDTGYQPPNGPYHMERCGVASRADASRLVDDLRNAGALDPFTFATSLDAGPYIELQLGDRAANRIVEVFVQPLLPDDTRCSRDKQPGGGGI